MEDLELRDYQRAALAFHLATPFSGDFSDPGTGKTIPASLLLYLLWDQRGWKSIWTMPKSLLKKNKDELLRFTPFESGEVVIIDGPPAKRKKLMATKGAKVFLWGFDGFSREWPELIQHHPEIKVLAGDEWHLGFKGGDTARTLSMIRFVHTHCEKLLAMTGTMVDGRLDACFGFIKAARPHLYRDLEHFRFVHGIMGPNNQIVAWRHLDRVAKILREIGFRITFEQAYGKEAKVVQVIPCDMDPKQREAYSEFEETALLELEDAWVDGSLPGVNIIRCRQLMEHPQTFGEPLDKIKYTGKEEQLLIDLEDHKNSGKPLVIFSALTPQHDRVVEICRKMGFRVGIIDGRYSARHRAQVDEDFRADRLDIVIASAATAGVGYNWGHVDHIVFMSLDYMDSNFIQAYRRAIRGKRDKPVLISVYEYRDSVDQRIFTIVEKKSKLAHDIDDTRERLQLKTKRVKPNGTPAVDQPMSFDMDSFISGN